MSFLKSIKSFFMSAEEKAAQNTNVATPVIPNIPITSDKTGKIVNPKAEESTTKKATTKKRAKKVQKPKSQLNFLQRHRAYHEEVAKEMKKGTKQGTAHKKASQKLG